MSGHRRIFVGLHQVEHLTDVSDGRIVKGPGFYYVSADVADDLLAALKLASELLPTPKPGSLGEKRIRRISSTVEQVIAKAEGRAEESELPTLGSLEGAASDMPLSMPSEEFVRRLRDEW